MLNGAQPVADPSWGFVIGRYPGAVLDLLRADGGAVRDGDWSDRRVLPRRPRCSCSRSAAGAGRRYATLPEGRRGGRRRVYVHGPDLQRVPPRARARADGRFRAGARRGATLGARDSPEQGSHPNAGAKEVADMTGTFAEQARGQRHPDASVATRRAVHGGPRRQRCSTPREQSTASSRFASVIAALTAGGVGRSSCTGARARLGARRRRGADHQLHDLLGCLPGGPRRAHGRDPDGLDANPRRDSAMSSWSAATRTPLSPPPWPPRSSQVAVADLPSAGVPRTGPSPGGQPLADRQPLGHAATSARTQRRR